MRVKVSESSTIAKLMIYISYRDTGRGTIDFYYLNIYRITLPLSTLSTLAFKIKSVGLSQLFG